MKGQYYACVACQSPLEFPKVSSIVDATKRTRRSPIGQSAAIRISYECECRPAPFSVEYAYDYQAIKTLLGPLSPIYLPYYAAPGPLTRLSNDDEARVRNHAQEIAHAIPEDFAREVETDE